MGSSGWMASAASFAWHASGAANVVEGGKQVYSGVRNASVSGVASGLGRMALGAAPALLGGGGVAASAAVRVVGGVGMAMANAAPSFTPMEGVRGLATAARNTARYLAGGMPQQAPQDLAQLGSVGLNPAITAELQTKSGPWSTWASSTTAKKDYSPGQIRVKAQNVLTNRPGATPSFVGGGMDEHIATRTQKKASNWNHHQPSVGEAGEVFGTRSRTVELIWATGDPAEPFAGHTPSFKRAAVGGTTAAITKQHGTRDRTRDDAVETTRADMSSPGRHGDTARMGALATLKHMASPSTELESAHAQLTPSHGPRYAALTGNNDLQTPVHFHNMVDHVQEGRERGKWEVASSMRSSPRLSPLVPPVMSSYLHAHGNDPVRAMNTFRHDLHHGTFAPPVNTSLHSATDDLTAQSLHGMAVQTQATGTRARALSDARSLPPVEPPNSRGH